MGLQRVGNQINHANKSKNVRFVLSRRSTMHLANKKMFASYAKMFALFACLFAGMFVRTIRTHVYKTCSFVRILVRLTSYPRAALTRDHDGGPAMPLGAANSKGNAS